jgi:hypothetical protein
MSNQKDGTLVTLLKKAAGFPTSNCCSTPAPATEPKEPEQKQTNTGSCCGPR